MPMKMRRPCAHRGCPNTAEKRYCKEHAHLERQRDKARGTAAQRGYGGRWQRYREIYLQKHPLCVECLKHKRVVPAKVVDHIKPHKGDYELFWREDNHQSLCTYHHNLKTATKDGGFGNNT